MHSFSFYKRCQNLLFFLLFFQVSQQVWGRNGLFFRETFRKGRINCTITYTITGTLPIKVKRTYRYKNGRTRTEYLILKQIGLEHAQEIYQLVSNSKEHLGRFLPFLLEEYGISEEIAYSHLKELILFNREGRAFKVGIFYQAQPNGPQVFIGIMGVHSLSYCIKNSFDAVYWVGAPHYIQVKGVVTPLLKAFTNFLVFTTPISRLNAVMLKSNKASRRVAEKIGMRPVKPPFKYRHWGYRENKRDVFVYTISRLGASQSRLIPYKALPFQINLHF